MPQHQGGKAVTYHTSVFPIKEWRGAVLLGIVERYPLCEVCMRSGERSQPEQCLPYRTVRHHQHGSVLGLLRQGEELLTQCLPRLIIGTHVIIPVQTT